MNTLQKKFTLIKWITIAVILAIIIYIGNNITYEHFIQTFQQSPIYLIIYLASWGFLLLLIYLYEKFLKGKMK